MPKFKVNSPDGKMYEVNAPEGATEEDAIAYVQKNLDTLKASQERETPSIFEQLGKDANQLRSLGIGATTGATMGFAPRIATEVGAPIAKAVLEGGELLSGGKYQAPSYQDLRRIGQDTYYGMQDEAKARNPVAYGAGEFGGLVGSGGILEKAAAQGLRLGGKVSIGAATKLGNFLSGGGGAVSRATSQGLKLGGIGALEGGIYGAGQSEDLLESVGAGVQSGALSALGGAALGAGASGLKSIAKPIVPIVGEKAINLMRPISKEVSPASKKVFGALSETMSPEEILQATKKAKISKDPLAVSMQSELQGVSKAVSNTPEGRKFAKEYFEQKKKMVRENLDKSISENLFKPVDTEQFIDDIVKKGQEKAAPLYEKAYEKNIKITPDLKPIVKNPVFQKALMEAQEIENIAAAADGRSPDILNVGIKGAVPTKIFDKVIKGIDEVAYKEQEVSGLKSEKVRQLKAFRKSLFQKISEQNPDLAEARAVSSDYITAKQSFELGKTFNSMDADLLKKEFSKLSPDNKAIMSAAMAQELRNFTLSKLSKGLGSEAGLSDAISDKKMVMGKIKAILPKSKYEKLEKSLNDEISMIRMSNSLLSGSETAMNQASKKWLDAGGKTLADNIAERGIMSIPQDIIANTIRTFSGDIPDNLRSKIAETVFSQDQKIQKQFLRDLKRLSNDKIRREATKAFVELRYASLKGYDKAVKSATTGLVVPIAEGE